VSIHQELPVRGARVPSSVRRVDLIVVAARYSPERRLEWVQAYERRGRVWSDKVVLDRRALLDRLQRKQRVHSGAEREIPGDFEVGPAVQLQRSGGPPAIVAGSKTTGADELGVPVL
jgi:hypothetical protein